MSFYSSRTSKYNEIILSDKDKIIYDLRLKLNEYQNIERKYIEISNEYQALYNK